MPGGQFLGFNVLDRLQVPMTDTFQPDRFRATPPITHCQSLDERRVPKGFFLMANRMPTTVTKANEFWVRQGTFWLARDCTSVSRCDFGPGVPVTAH